MDKIEHEILQLTFLRQMLKVEINSIYGVSKKNNIKSLFERRDKITREIKRLYKIKERKEKINKIKIKIYEN
jgi:hypothetical protein